MVNLLRAGALLAFVMASFNALASKLEQDSIIPGQQSKNAGTSIAKVSKAKRAEILKRIGSMRMRFEENQGQMSPSVDFFAHGNGYDVFLSPTEAVARLPVHKDSELSSSACKNAVFSIRFVGASKTASAQGDERLPGMTNYISEKRGRFRVTGINSYAKVNYKQIYPGIDVVYYGNGRELQYDFVVSPGGDPESIRIALDGVDSLKVNKDGDLVFAVEGHELKMTKPLIYQNIGAKRRMVHGLYERVGESELAFRLSDYDASEPLIIDPVLIYSTYLGGTDDDQATAIAIDADGNAYIAGFTYSGDFPLVNAYDTRVGNSDRDMFVTKLDPTGTNLVYSTFIGGDKSLETAKGIAVDSDGNAYVVGGSIIKLNPQGNDLIYSTPIPGATVHGVAIGPDASVYITGETYTLFEATPGALMTDKPGFTSAFVARLRPDGSAMHYATFLGGSGTDIGKTIAVDADGNAYVGGSTTSADFPLQNAIQSAFQSTGDRPDGFVSILDPEGSALLFSSYIGGELSDSVNGLALDGDGNIFLAGETYSSDFPVKGGFQNKAGYRLTNSSLGNAFVMKMAALGRSILYSSYLGGEVCKTSCYSVFPTTEFQGDAAYDIAVDNAGHAIVTGLAESYTFPLIYSQLPAKTQDNYHSLFVTKVSASGSALLYSTLMGQGWSGDTTITPGSQVGGISASVPGSVYVSGASWEVFPTTSGAFQGTPQGGDDAIAFRLDSGPLAMTLSDLPDRVFAAESVQLVVSLSEDTLPGNVMFLSGRDQIGTSAVVNGQASAIVQLAPGVHTLSAYYRSSELSGSSPPKYLVVDAVRNCQ